MVLFDGSVRICPVELKGRNISRGLRQLEVTCRGFERKLGEGEESAGIELRAGLLSTASEPHKSRFYRRSRERLEQLLGSRRLLVKTGLPRRAMFDLGPFLRA